MEDLSRCARKSTSLIEVVAGRQLLDRPPGVPVLKHLHDVDHFEVPPCHVALLLSARGVYNDKGPGGKSLVPTRRWGITPASTLGGGIVAPTLSTPRVAAPTNQQVRPTCPLTAGAAFPKRSAGGSRHIGRRARSGPTPPAQQRQPGAPGNSNQARPAFFDAAARSTSTKF